jgi:hypothetical protein
VVLHCDTACGSTTAVLEMLGRAENTLCSEAVLDAQAHTGHLANHMPRCSPQSTLNHTFPAVESAPSLFSKQLPRRAQDWAAE